MTSSDDNDDNWHSDGRTEATSNGNAARNPHIHPNFYTKRNKSEAQLLVRS